MRGPGLEILNVSRETYALLERYADLLVKWNPRINLVSKSSLEHLWMRHISDSLQVARAVQFPKQWVDLGSGGGFPGIVAAIAAHAESPNTSFTLIESDQRKSAFLRTVARECGLNVTVLSERIEKVQPQNAGVVSARALADLKTLLGYAVRHVAPTGTLLFSKGKTWGKEVDEAQAVWKFDCETVKSATDPEAVLLIIKGVSRD